MCSRFELFMSENTIIVHTYNSSAHPFCAELILDGNQGFPPFKSFLFARVSTVKSLFRIDMSCFSVQELSLSSTCHAIYQIYQHAGHRILTTF
jgi:hypothetical protein